MKILTLASGDPLSHVLPHPISHEPLMHWNFDFTAPLNLFTIKPHDTYFTNHLLMSLVAAVIVLIGFTLLGRRYAAMSAAGVERNIPSGFTNLIEAMMQFIRVDVVRPVLGDKTDRFMPFLWTVFFYILTCNLLGMIPLAEIIGAATGGRLEHIGGTATGNIMITAGLAFCAFVMIHLSGAMQVYRDLVAGTYGHHHEHDEDHALHGEGHEFGLAHDPSHHGHHSVDKWMAPPAAAILAPILYVWNFAPHVFKPEKIDSPMAILLLIADVIMWAVLLVLESIGAIIKPFALAVRLFANMVAGHVVLASILALITGLGTFMMESTVGPMIAVGCAALSCLELFVAFLQAYIFTFLTSLFIGASVSPEH
ncbi:MAG: F0F1 ATP synthase subunit A [Phycisphaerae bacterium]|nr:F0F1 ATP synthase subunit A [Phycisphaerae bacterium]